ncbi:MAG: 5'-nucleotidase [Erysipelotrichaceae bacterium]
MATQFNDCLVIAISSRALFDLSDENDLYEKEGLKAYSDYQITHEKDILKPGAGFSLVKALLSLNKKVANKQIVEVIITSRNSADTSLRIFNSIEYYGLDISRAILSGGHGLAQYLLAFNVDLFLSAYEDDVQEAIDFNIAAGMIYTNPLKNYDENTQIDPIRIAFDGDAVLFSDEAELIYKKDGLEAFVKHEKANAQKPLPEGPFAKFLKTISHLQESFPLDNVPIRTALVTARNAPAHERVIKTLRAWNVRIDEAFFLGGMSKKDILAAFAPHIFFDDQVVHAIPASTLVPSAKVPYKNKTKKG